MKKMQCQVQPGNEKEPQRSFGRHATAPRQEERGLPLPFMYVNSLGQSAGSPSDPQLAEVADTQATYQYEQPDGAYFKRVSLTLVGAPDLDGRRSRLVRDLLWGRLGPEQGDAGPAARVLVPKSSHVLEGGAAADLEAEPALAA